MPMAEVVNIFLFFNILLLVLFQELLVVDINTGAVESLTAGE